MAEVTEIKDRAWFKRFHRQEFEGTHNNAMYKGVPFIIVDDDSTFGRRTVQHEFPQRDVPYSEDLGRSVRKFLISGELLGDDYLEQRDNLVFICEEEGEGELVHPYYGILNVICKQISITDNRTETRICKFQAEFVESGSLTFPIISVDTKAKVELDVDNAFVSSSNAFQKAYRSVKKQLAYLDGTKQVYNQALDYINEGKKIANMPAEYVSAFNASKALAQLTVLSGLDLFNTVLNLVTFGLIPEDENIDLDLSFLGLSGDFEGDTLSPSDDSDLIEGLINQCTVITLALITSKLDYESVEQATKIRDVVLSKIDGLLELGVDTQLAQDFREIQKSIGQDIDERSITLPLSTTHTPIMTLPALVITHTLYGNVDKEQDVIARNRIQHPGFTPGGEVLEVLVDA